MLCGLKLEVSTAERTLGAGATAFGSLSPWLRLAGVGLQSELGNTHLKAKTFFSPVLLFFTVMLGKD